MDRNTVKDPKAQVFWSAASARKPHLAAGKKLGDEGFGRGRTAIGHAQKAGDGSQATPILRRWDGCEWFGCEGIETSVTRVACTPLAFLGVMYAANLHRTFRSFANTGLWAKAARSVQAGLRRAKIAARNMSAALLLSCVWPQHSMSN